MREMNSEVPTCRPQEKNVAALRTFLLDELGRRFADHCLVLAAFQRRMRRSILAQRSVDVCSRYGWARFQEPVAGNCSTTRPTNA